MPSPYTQDNVVKQFGHSSIVVSIEVVEHLYDPRSFAMSLLG
jgi:2-polyprenyl-3-methyl-5-hydroxy-6-metoxy-1,4-benzoquinol methylase